MARSSVENLARLMYQFRGKYFFLPISPRSLGHGNALDSYARHPLARLCIHYGISSTLNLNKLRRVSAVWRARIDSRGEFTRRVGKNLLFAFPPFGLVRVLSRKIVGRPSCTPELRFLPFFLQFFLLPRSISLRGIIDSLSVHLSVPAYVNFYTKFYHRLILYSAAFSFVIQTVVERCFGLF